MWWHHGTHLWQLALQHTKSNSALLCFLGLFAAVIFDFVAYSIHAYSVLAMPATRAMQMQHGQATVDHPSTHHLTITTNQPPECHRRLSILIMAVAGL